MYEKMFSALEQPTSQEINMNNLSAGRNKDKKPEELFNST
jgi:hypothetical protein